jgi:hypothetical protein
MRVERGSNATDMIAHYDAAQTLQSPGTGPWQMNLAQRGSEPIDDPNCLTASNARLKWQSCLLEGLNQQPPDSQNLKVGRILFEKLPGRLSEQVCHPMQIQKHLLRTVYSQPATVTIVGKPWCDSLPYCLRFGGISKRFELIARNDRTNVGFGPARKAKRWYDVEDVATARRRDQPVGHTGRVQLVLMDPFIVKEIGVAQGDHLEVKSARIAGPSRHLSGNFSKKVQSQRSPLRYL